jgi:hypothetical protein
MEDVWPGTCILSAVMTAGVQNLESSAYLPPPPSTPAPAAKGTGSADQPTSDTQGEPRNFQSELARQDSATQAAESAGRPKPGSDKPGKKRDTSADDSNPSAATPAQAADPAKQNLSLVLTLAKPDEQAKPDEHANPGGGSSQQESPLSGAALLQAGNAAHAAPDSSKIPALPLATDVPVPSPDQSAAAAQPGTSPENQPPSQARLKLPDAAPAEPTAAALKASVDSAPSSPSALAFAARLAAVPQKTGQAVPENPSPSPDAAGSPAPARIPVRFAATAQILQDAGAAMRQGEGPKPDPGAAIDRSARTDMVLPRFETASQAASSSGSAAPQQTVPTARMERVIEPPAAPPTSANDIRVRVPDNNGGSTQVRFVESGGEVRVSVRTADEGLAQNLRTHLNDLTQRLAEGGIPAEIWKPGSAAASSQNNQQQPDREGRGSGGQQSGGQGGQQDRQQKRPAWLEEMDASLQGPKE